MAIENIVKANADILGLLLPHCPIVDYNSIEGADVLHFDAQGRQVMVNVYNRSTTARELTKRQIERIVGTEMAVDKDILADNLEKMAEYRLDMTGMSADIVDVAVGRYMQGEASMEAETSAVID